MSFAGWLTFTAFWAAFVTSPGPNAVNCISNGMAFGFRRALIGVAAILTQAALFLTLAAAGVTAALAAMPSALGALKIAGALVLIWLGLRGILRAGTPIAETTPSAQIYLRAFLIATLNVKSLMGYLAAFTQFIEVDRAIWPQMAAIYPTALTLTALSYCGWTALGAWTGRGAYRAVANLWFRRVMGATFVAYGLVILFLR